MGSGFSAMMVASGIWPAPPETKAQASTVARDMGMALANRMHWGRSRW